VTSPSSSRRGNLGSKGLTANARLTHLFVYLYSNKGWFCNSSTDARNKTTTYTYDANGNRTSVTIGANNYPYTVAAASNRLNATAGPSPAKTFTHDAAGNVTADGTQTFVYSNRGRMSSTTRGSSTVSASAHTASVRSGAGSRGRKEPAHRDARGGTASRRELRQDFVDDDRDVGRADAHGLGEPF